MESTKGNMVSLKTFQTYETNNVVGYKTINIQGKIKVNFAWCKLRAKHKNAIYNNPKRKGNAKKSAKFTLEGQITPPNEALTNI